MWRAFLISAAKHRWCWAQTPVLALGIIFPLSVTNLRNRDASLYSGRVLSVQNAQTLRRTKCFRTNRFELLFALTIHNLTTNLKRNVINVDFFS